MGFSGQLLPIVYFPMNPCAGTTTHFIRAAFAAIIPLNESSKQIQFVG